MTPIKVTSYIHKYFIWQTKMFRRKKYLRLFGIIVDKSIDTALVSHDLTLSNAPKKTQNNNLLPHPPALDEEYD